MNGRKAMSNVSRAGRKIPAGRRRAPPRSAASSDEVAVSVVSEAELRTGAAKSSSPSKTLQSVEAFLGPMTIFDFTSEDAIAYARIRAKLERAGTPIGPLDTMIAAHAV